MATKVIKQEDPEQKFETTLTLWTEKTQALTVKTVDECFAAKTMQRELREDMKRIHLVFDGFVNDAKENLLRAKDRLAKHIDPREKLDGLLASKVKDFERREREAAAAEERRINEERRITAEKEAAEQRKRDYALAAEQRKQHDKEIEHARKAGEVGKREADKLKKEAEEHERLAKIQAQTDAERAKQKAEENQIKVQPNIPTVAGVPSRRNYYAAVVNADYILGRFVFQVFEGSKQLRVPGQFVDVAKMIAESQSPLRKFIIIDEKALNAEARAVKDPKKLEQLIPGIHAWED